MDTQMKKSVKCTKKSNIIRIVAVLICLTTIVIGLVSCTSYEIQGTYMAKPFTEKYFTLKFKGNKVEFMTDVNGEHTSSKGTWELTDEVNKYDHRIGVIEFDVGMTDEFYLRDDGKIEFGNLAFTKQ